MVLLSLADASYALKLWGTGQLGGCSVEQYNHCTRGFWPNHCAGSANHCVAYLVAMSGWVVAPVILRGRFSVLVIWLGPGGGMLLSTYNTCVADVLCTAACVHLHPEGMPSALTDAIYAF